MTCREFLRYWKLYQEFLTLRKEIKISGLEESTLSNHTKDSKKRKLEINPIETSLIESIRKEMNDTGSKDITKEIGEFIYKNQHLALKENLKIIKFAMDNPEIIKPETLRSLELIKRTM